MGMQGRSDRRCRSRGPPVLGLSRRRWRSARGTHEAAPTPCATPCETPCPTPCVAAHVSSPRPCNFSLTACTSGKNQIGHEDATTICLQVKPKQTRGIPPAPPPVRTLSRPPLLRAQSSTTVRSSSVKTPFGRRLHWVDPSYDLNKTNVYTCGDPDGENVVRFDADLLHHILGDAVTARQISVGASPSRRRCSSVPRGICVFHGPRAQNLAIILRRLPLPVEELCTRLRSQDFLANMEGTPLHAEDVERLLHHLPTAQETRALMAHTEHVEELRDVEQKLLPLCLLPDVGERLRLLHVSLAHNEQYAQLHQRLDIFRRAAEELLQSRRLHSLLRLVLKTANYINHGDVVGATALPPRSLPAVGSFKVGSASALHYLCLLLCDSSFLLGLDSELPHLRLAAQDTTAAQELEITRFGRLLATAEQHGGIDMGSTPSAACLVTELNMQHDKLKGAAKIVRDVAERAQCFLGEVSEPPPPFEELCRYIAEFLDILSRTSTDIARRPESWRPRLKSTAWPGALASAAGA